MPQNVMGLYNKKLHKKTLQLVEQAREILLASAIAMTVRQCFYQIVVRHYIQNTPVEYRRLGDTLVDARKLGLIPWKRIEDRLRKPRRVPMWDDGADFGECVAPQYRRDICFPNRSTCMCGWRKTLSRASLRMRWLPTASR